MPVILRHAKRFFPLEAVRMGRGLRRGVLAVGLCLAMAAEPSAQHPSLGGVDRIGPAWEDARNPIVRLFGGQRLDLWSLRPLRPVAPLRNSCGTLLDGWLHAKGGGTSIIQQADPRTLLRRLTLDLTGLPPTADEVDAFVRECSVHFSSDWTEVVYARAVDRLLASPRYGEHQARLWLDVIRYSDSNGFDWDEFRPRAWQFRDYVIRAFNQDKPYDQFIVEQLAGDELLSGPPRDAGEQDALVATGYLRLGPHDNAAPLFNEQDRSRAELMADLTETTGSAFLGLTLSCSRCHDHKTDPISQIDHYRLRAFFEGVRFADDLPLDLRSEQEAIRRHNEAVDRETALLERDRDLIRGEVRERLKGERLAALTQEERDGLALPVDRHPEDRRERVTLLRQRVEPSNNEVTAALTVDQKSRLTALETQIAESRSRRRPFTLGLLMTDTEGVPPETRVLFLGDHKRPREGVQPGFLSILDPNPAVIPAPPNPKTLGRRLALARWIASSSNPLTARVLVNRIWQQHFGRGIVETANDFGLAGARPSSPELLDALALEFMQEGWSVKRLHRRLVLSAAYRRAGGGGQDASDALGGPRFPHRLSAEQLRDSLLASAGMLQWVSGGPPVWPQLPAEILQANPAFLDDNETRTKGWYPSAPDRQGVRSIFLIQKRTVRLPFMETFDLPENSTSCPRRMESTVAPQALSLLNSPMTTEVARRLADRVRGEAGADTESQVETLFRLTLQRRPEPEERAACLRLLQRRSLPELCRAILNLNEFVYVD